MIFVWKTELRLNSWKRALDSSSQINPHQARNPSKEHTPVGSLVTHSLNINHQLSNSGYLRNSFHIKGKDQNKISRREIGGEKSNSRIRRTFKNWQSSEGQDSTYWFLEIRRKWSRREDSENRNSYKLKIWEHI